MATAKQRLALSRARRDANIALGELIETEEMSDVARVRLRMGFVAVLLANKGMEAIKILCLKLPGYTDVLQTVSALFQEAADADPQHFIHAILDATGGEEYGESAELVDASGDGDDALAAE
jgi:hypothetical protein